MRVQDAVAAVRAFTAEGELGSPAIEFRAPLNQFSDSLRSVFYKNSRGFWLAKAVAGLQSVLKMEADFIFVAEGCRDAALRKLGIRFSYVAFGQHQYVAGGGEFDGSTQPSNTSAYNQEVDF
jgi:hypothetical protein